MNEITREMWRRGIRQKDYCLIHKISPAYLRAILAGRRGRAQAGEAERIINQLKRDGYWECLEQSR